LAPDVSKHDPGPDGKLPKKIVLETGSWGRGTEREEEGKGAAGKRFHDAGGRYAGA
jgi:hypothetical protein